MTRSSICGLAGIAGLTLAPALLVVVPVGAANAADPTCVGKGEYASIHSGMTIQKLARVLDGQAPFVDEASHAKQNVRWYAACDDWDPINDVIVRYHAQVVGRRTVINKKLAVYTASPRAG